MEEGVDAVVNHLAEIVDGAHLHILGECLLHIVQGVVDSMTHTRDVHAVFLLHAEQQALRAVESDIVRRLGILPLDGRHIFKSQLLA